MLVAPMVLAVVSAAALVLTLAPPLRWQRRRPRPPVPTVTGPRTGPAAEASRLTWRATWVTVLLRVVLVVALGLTPLGASFVRWVAPTDQDPSASVPLPIIGVAFVAVGLLPTPWRRRAAALAPHVYKAPTGRVRVLRWLMPAAMGLLYSMAATTSETVAVLAVLATAVYAAVLVAVRRPEIRDSSVPPGLQSAVDHLGQLLPSSPPRVAAGRPAGSVPMAAIDERTTAPFAIVVAPEVVDAFDTGSLVQLLAHETAHLRSGDLTRVRLTFASTVVLCASVSLCLSRVDVLQQLAGAQGPVQLTTGPLLLALAYLTLRVLQVGRLWSSRAMERRADAGMLDITGDPAAAARALANLSDWFGSPYRWTRWQYVLVASHPASAERVLSVRTGNQGRPSRA